MDLWVGIAMNVVLQVLANRQDVRKFAKVIAKVYVQIERWSSVVAELRDEIEHQRKKEGLT